MASFDCATLRGTHVQKGRNGVAVNVDHLQIGEAVDASHAESHDAEDERETGQRPTHRHDHHADRHDRRTHQQHAVRIHSDRQNNIIHTHIINDIHGPTTVFALSFFSRVDHC